MPLHEKGMFFCLGNVNFHENDLKNASAKLRLKTEVL